MKIAIMTALAAAAAMAQAPPERVNIAYQQAGWFSGGTGPIMVGTFETPFPDQNVAGKPFSGKEERHTLQVLGDGTRIERTESSMFYRDDQGRTRVEHSSDAGTAITINDPVAGFTVFLDPATKTAQKLPMPPKMAMRVAAKAASEAGFRAVRTEAHGGGVMMTQTGNIMTMMKTKVLAEKARAPEALGTNVVNGVTADGSRTVMTIPVGQIGNDREIRIVNERWYSPELQTLIKSSSSDPRFGETTYELTNISRTAPDPTLFEVPGDYTVREAGKVETVTTTVTGK